MDLERARKEVLKTLFEYLEKEKLLIVLFGSRSHQDKQSADLDLLLFYPQAIDDETFLTLQEKLNSLEEIPCKIDLLEGRALSEAFLEEALVGARIWHIGKDWIKNLKTSRGPLKN